MLTFRPVIRYHLFGKKPLIKNFKYLSVLIAAIILGNWYMAEYKKARIAGLPWYRAYFTLPGILIVLIILFLPVVARFI